MKIYYLNPPLSMRSVIADTAWMNFNTYCSEYDWIEPIINWDLYQNVDQVINEILRENPSVLCISTYVWNHKLCFEVCKKIKEICKDIIIIMGGPHQGFSPNFFEEHHYIDYLCQATSHGELFLKSALEQISKHGKIIHPEMVPFLISRNFTADFKSIKFDWGESSAIENNISYLSKVKNTALELGKASTFHYETTRGCPYGCVYCEWGGGINAKVSQKPLTMAIKDLEICSMLGFTELNILDANFGILDRDAEILEHIISFKKIFGYPKDFGFFGIAKTKIEKRKRILDLVFEHKLSEHYPMSIQAYDEAVLKNVKRTDVAFEENYSLGRHYRQKYGVDVKVELILGLPGYTLDTFYKEMDLYQEFNSWFSPRNIFNLLPDSEANSRMYRALHKIQSVIVGTTDNEEQDIKYESQNILGKYRSSSEIVVSTFSFTSEDWKEMYFMSRAQQALGPKVPNGQSASVYLKIQYDKIKQKEWFLPIKKHLDDIVNGMLYNKDIALIDHELIEDIVKKHEQDI